MGWPWQVGTALLAAAHDWASNQGCSTLFATSLNPVARAVFTKNGFTDHGVAPFQASFHSSAPSDTPRGKSQEHGTLEAVVAVACVPMKVAAFVATKALRLVASVGLRGTYSVLCLMPLGMPRPGYFVKEL